MNICHKIEFKIILLKEMKPIFDKIHSTFHSIFNARWSQYCDASRAHSCHYIKMKVNSIAYEKLIQTKSDQK